MLWLSWKREEWASFFVLLRVYQESPHPLLCKAGAWGESITFNLFQRDMGCSRWPLPMVGPGNWVPKIVYFEEIILSSSQRTEDSQRWAGLDTVCSWWTDPAILAQWVLWWKMAASESVNRKNSCNIKAPNEASARLSGRLDGSHSPVQ